MLAKRLGLQVCSPMRTDRHLSLGTRTDRATGLKRFDKGAAPLSHFERGERWPLRRSKSCPRLDFVSPSKLGSGNDWSQRNTRTAITNDRAAATIANIVVVVFESVANPSISDMLPSTHLF